MTERTVEKGYQDYKDCRQYRGQVFRMWYPRGETVVFGVWQHETDCEEGDCEWSEDIPGWSLPMSPPHVELVFPLPASEEALRRLLEQGSEVDGLRGALRQVTGR